MSTCMRVAILIILFPFDQVSGQSGRDINRPPSSLSQVAGLAPDIASVNTNLQTIRHADSVLYSRLQHTSTAIVNQLKTAVQQSLSNVRKNKLTLPRMPSINMNMLKSLKKPQVGNAVFNAVTSGWQSDTANSVYWQNNLGVQITAFGIPLSAEGSATWNYFNGSKRQRFIYRINYNKNAFAEKLGLNKSDMKATVAEGLDFTKQFNYKELITNTFSAVPEVNSIVRGAGCNWTDLLEMPVGEFAKRYNKTVLTSKIADAQKLKNYYEEYAKKSADAALKAKVAAADSQLTKIKEGAALYEKLLKVKMQADALLKKVQAMRQLYEEKVKGLLEGYNVISQAVKANGNLSGLQKFMMKVKGLQIGQHTINAGNLVLENFLQNGVTFEYETDKSFLLLTKGSQARLEYPGYFPQNGVSTQNGLNTYYQAYSRYSLTGVSVGRGNKQGNYQQVSLMNFNKLSSDGAPVLFGKTVNVISLGQQFVTGGGQKLSVDLSKSIVKKNSATGSNTASSNFFDAVAVSVKYEFKNNQTQDRQKLNFFYSTPAYNNPGLNGGINRPGFLLDYGFTRQLNKRFRLANQLAWYSFNYGNSFSLRSLRDKIDLSYRVKKMRIGTVIHTSYANQLQYNPKQTYNTRSLDVLATAQVNKRLHNLYFNVNGGVGYGYSQQESFNKAKDWSFFANAAVTLKGFTLDINADKFNTRNTEVFLIDSAALVFVSSFNLQGTVGYTTPKGDFIQGGVVYKKFNDAARQFFVTANGEWRFFKKVMIGGNLNLPLSAPASSVFINNIFNAKLIYNINGHDK